MTRKALLVAGVLGVTAAAVLAQSTIKGTSMTHAKGTFEVKMTPTTHAPDPSLNSLAMEKTYHGELEATAKGEMISAGDPKTGNAGYVAIERISGTLNGRAGTFALMQLATMSLGTAPQMTVTVVPGSGTEQLSGIYGTLTINIADGKHSYALDYAFAGK